MTPALVDARQGPPGDGEIRTWRNDFTNDTHSTVTLILRGPKGPLPINLVVQVIHRYRAARGKPPDVTMEFQMPLFTGVFDVKRPHVTFVIDRKLESEKVTEANVDASVPIHGADSVIMPFTLARLETLAIASSIDGRVFGIDFVLTPRQIRAIQDFYRKQPR